MKKWIITGLLIFLAANAVVMYLIFSGPRMKSQPHIRSFQAEMPLPPAGVVPVEPAAYTATPSPPPATPENIAIGRIAYGYYCAFCHGQGDQYPGPVGESYFPTPPDLRNRKYKDTSDVAMLRAIMTGTGHSPVLEYTVLPEHRWYLVLYTRNLANGGK